MSRWRAPSDSSSSSARCDTIPRRASRSRSCAVNPFDVAETADAIAAGLEMPREDRVRRARGLTRAVLARNPVRWLTAQLRDLDALRGIVSQRAEELEEAEGARHHDIGDLDEALGGR